MRTLAIDLGTRRVGFAMSDEGGKFATPLEVLEITSPQQARDAVLKLIQSEDVQRLLMGLPLNMDGTFGPQARTTVDWARDVSSRSGKPVVFVDERLSSFEAEQVLAEQKRAGQKLTRKGKKQRLDALVAARLLQEFLDGKLPAIEL
jgi:putative Holliday junction resolvase